MELALENCILGLLNLLDHERCTEISQLLESGSLAIPLNILKEIKQNVVTLSISAPDLFLNAAALYYAKFIQSIKFVNLASDYALIPQYLKTIEIMKSLCSKLNIDEVKFEPFITIIIDSIKEIFLSYESIEKIFECLNILKKIEDDFAIPISGQKQEYEFIDIGIQEFVENEEDLIKSYFAMKKVKEGWNFDLFYSEGSWIAKARKWLREENKEDCDKSLIENILILLYSFKNEYYPEIEEEVIRFCEGFAIESSNILNSGSSTLPNIELSFKTFIPSSDFSPIFENYCISHRSQFKFIRPPIHKVHKHITVWKGYSFLNLNHICIKEYMGNDKDVLDQYGNEIQIGQRLAEIGSPLYLQHFSNFKDGENHYIVMELCIKDLRDLIANRQQFSKADLAYFSHSFIKGLSELKNKKQIYHRDIKPGNIMIGYDNEFKLIDFNVSVVFERDSEMAGIGLHSNKGTPNYYSPEKYNQPENQEKHEHSRELNDVYSLGLVILEMSTLEVIVNHRDNETLFIQQIDEQMSKIETTWLSNLIREMLTYDYRHRPRFGRLLEMIEQDPEFMNDKNKERSKFI